MTPPPPTYTTSMFSGKGKGYNHINTKSPIFLTPETHIEVKRPEWVAIENERLKTKHANQD